MPGARIPPHPESVIASASPIGRQYKVRGVLGRGTFGTVYRADQLGAEGFARTVALKVLNDGGTTEIAERLREEARVLGLLQHRAIVKVDGLVALDDRWTIVMEYVDGVDLRRLIQAGRMPVAPAVELVGEVASALHVAQHQLNRDGEPLGLLHRDLKPSNILLTAHGEVKVVDFGTARANYTSRKARTVGHVSFGSPGFVAPERLMGEDVPAGDVYSLGVVFHDLLAESTFPGGDPRRDRHEPVVDAALGALPDVPEAVIELLRSMLAADPAQRPTARAIERRCLELRRTLDGPWLRDWAEDAVREVPSMVATGHDFSQSLLFEKQGVASPGATLDPGADSFAPDSILTSTPGPNTFYVDDEESEEPPGDGDPLAGQATMIRRTPSLPPAGSERPWRSWLLFTGAVLALSSVAFLFGMAVVGLAWAALAFL